MSSRSQSLAVGTPLNAVGQVWWREPYVWMVVGGPLVVVVAAVATAAIAFKNPDPVLDTRKIAATDAVAAQALRQAQSPDTRRTSDTLQTGLTNLQPAMLGRNHAVSPLPLAPVDRP